MDGYLSPLEEPGLGVPYFGGYDKLDECLENPGIDEVVVALEADEIQMLPRTFAACDKHGTRITMVPFYSDYLPAPSHHRRAGRVQTHQRAADPL